MRSRACSRDATTSSSSSTAHRSVAAPRRKRSPVGDRGMGPVVVDAHRMSEHARYTYIHATSPMPYTAHPCAVYPARVAYAMDRISWEPCRLWYGQPIATVRHEHARCDPGFVCASFFFYRIDRVRDGRVGRSNSALARAYEQMKHTHTCTHTRDDLDPDLDHGVTIGRSSPSGDTHANGRFVAHHHHHHHHHHRRSRTDARDTFVHPKRPCPLNSPLNLS